MDCKKMMALLVAIAVFVPEMASAKSFVVGDAKGWGFGVNYTEWAMGKNFQVGDTLIFNYVAANHDVVKVDGNGLSTCTAPAGSEALTTGKDAVVLAAGDNMFLCSKIGHCHAGMQLAVTVDTSSSKAESVDATPASSPAPAGHGYWW